MMRYFKLICYVNLFFTLTNINAQNVGFFLDDWESKGAEIPLSIFVDKPTDDPTVNINVDTNNVLAKIPKYIYGNNAVTWDSGLPKNVTAMKDLKNLNPHVLRWPGGNLSNNYFWNLSESNRPNDIPSSMEPWYGQNTTWQLSVNEYYKLLTETNSTGIICVNYSYARYGTGSNPVATAAHMAAEWVRYDNGRSKFWEIGNENFGSWQAGYQIDVTKNQDGQPEYISGKLYGQHCKVFIDSMRSAASEIGVDIKIGVVAYDAENSYDPISQVWNEGMMPEVGDIADYMIVHSYFTPYEQNSSVSTILNSHTVPEEIMTVIENDMAEAEKPMLPVAMTEWNIFAEGSMQQVSYVNGMLAALTLGEYVKSGYGLATRWDLVNGWDNGNDHGMFSTGGEPGVDAYNPRAVFFYMYYFQKYMGDNMVHSSVIGSNDVVVHASTFSSGETGLVIVNKGRTAETTQVDFDNSEPGLRYYTYTLTGGSDNGDFSRKVYVNGQGTDEQGGGPDNYESIKAFSYRTRNGIIVDLPPLSVAYVLVDKNVPLSYDYSSVDTNAHVISVELSEDVLPFDSAPGFEVISNGTTPLTISNIEQDESRQYVVNLFLEEEIDNDDNIIISYSGSNIVSLDSIELAAFTNETVENLLPGDPLTIEFVVKNTESEKIVAGCNVTFNDSTLTSNENGIVSFLAPPDEYSVVAEKKHLNALNNFTVNISSDTIITLYLDSTNYEVDFQLTDIKTGEKLSSVVITSGSQTQLTNSIGEGSLRFFAGEQYVMFEKVNFTTLQTTYQIEGDTTIAVELQRSHADIKFKLLEGDQPINSALVVFGDDTLSTSSLGTCTFESVAIDSNYTYHANKENYYPTTGSVLLSSDTTIVLQLEKSVASVEFLINTENGSFQNARAILDNDTSDFNAEGHTKFFNIDKRQKYGYTIYGDNFDQYTDSVFVVSDTIISFSFVVGVADNFYSTNGFEYYPNPVSDVLYVRSEFNIFNIELIDISGTILRSIYCKSSSCALDVSNLSKGYYFIRVNYETGKASGVKPLIIIRK